MRRRLAAQSAMEAYIYSSYNYVRTPRPMSTANTIAMVDALEAPSPVEQLVDAAPVEIDDDMVLRLIYDLAQRIHTAATIAKRYGFKTEPSLKKWLNEH